MYNILTGELLVEMLKGAGANLELNKSALNALNVFPVPDGDTGTNMGLTMSSCLKEVATADQDSIKSVAAAFAKGSLRGARGNSGVILSQILKGISEVFTENQTITTKIFAKALVAGAKKAYDAVTKPKEGTLLTVIRMTGEYAVKIAGKNADFSAFFTKILKKANEVLDDTPNMLPVLKQAGVVDSGGKGLVVILDGMLKVLNGEEIVAPQEEAAISYPQQQEFVADIHNLDEITFAYCTEFFVINLKKDATIADIDRLRDQLMGIGDCVVVVGDLQLVKVHVHTNNPDLALGYALALGELDRPKIENMLEQNRELRRMQKPKERKKMAMMAISNGKGLSAIFEELGVDATVQGGQTMNTSVADIVDAATNVNADIVYVLPNNKNIILAAEQAKDLVSFELVVIATKSVQEGIVAAIAFDPDSSVEENTRNMQKAASDIKTAEVTHAVRDVQLDGFDLKTGDIIGIEKGVIAKGDDVNSVTLEVVKKLVDSDSCMVTAYYGDDVDESLAEKLRESIETQVPDVDVAICFGGQAYYSYLVAVE